MPMPAKNPQLHRIQGTKSQAELPDQSTVAAGKPKLPKSLKSPAARAAFRDACNALQARRALTPGDGRLLVLYAVLVSRHEQAQAVVDTEGLIVTYTRLNNHGEEVQTQKPNIALKIAQDCERQLVSILDRLGLTPRHRDSVKPTAPKKRKPVTVPGSVAWELEQQAEDAQQQSTPDFSDIEDVEI
jgi:P27 family predicted phage terminase small subunit